MIFRKFIAVTFLLALTCAAPALTWAAELIQVSDSVWRVQGDRRGAAVASAIVTADGIAVVDSTCRSEGDAPWLKAELARRFGVPVKYVILSHDHEDHICGLQVFDDTATTVSHAKTREHVVREGRNTSVPDVVFTDRMSLFLGDKQIDLLHFGPTHSDNLIQVHVPDEKVLIAPDFMQSGKGLIPDFRDMDVDNLLAAMDKVYKMDDVEIIVHGHGAPTGKESIRYQVRFISTLRERVLAEMVRGSCLSEIFENVTMSEFSDWRGHPQWLEADIATMWDYLYRKREPNLGPAHDAWQSVVDKIVNGASAVCYKE